MSREKQIEEMARTLCGEKEITCRECDSYDACEFWAEASVLYNADYRKRSEPFSQAHENGSEWISVEERLPKPTYCVLVYGVEGEMEIDALGYDGEWMGYVDVTHWMPLPESPKMKGGVRE